MSDYDDFSNILEKYVDVKKIEDIIDTKNISKELEVRFELDFSVNEILDVIRSLQKYNIEKEISIVEYHNEKKFQTERKIIYKYPETKVVTEKKTNISSDKFNIQGFLFKISYSVETIQDIILLEVPKDIRKRERYIIKDFVNDKYELHLTIVTKSDGKIENKIEIEYSINKIKEVGDLTAPIKELFDILYVKSVRLLRNSKMNSITNEFNNYLAYMKLSIINKDKGDRKKDPLSNKDQEDQKKNILISYEDKPIALKRENIKDVRTKNYFVTNKLNGTRYYLYIRKGTFYLVGRTGSNLTKKNNIYTFVWIIHQTPRTEDIFILDGEYFFNTIELEGENVTKLYYVFDILFAKIKNVEDPLYKKPYSQRYGYIDKTIRNFISNNKTPVEVKPIQYGIHTFGIIRLMKKDFKDLWDYKNDGLIYTHVNNVYGIEGPKTLKWKFDHHQSVDVKVKKYVKGANNVMRTIGRTNILEGSEIIKEADKEKIKLKDFFYDDEKVDLNKLKLTKESVYSVTPWKEADEISKEIIKRLNMKPESITITDATANVGGNTLSFYKNKIGKVNSFEIDTLTCNFLKNNLCIYGYTAKNVLCKNYLIKYMDIEQDVIFFDPPWGGPEYYKKKNLSLYLGDIDIKYIIKNLLDDDKAKLVVVKVPSNFASEEFKKYLYIYKIDKVPVYRVKKGESKLSYDILYIQNTYLKDYLYDCYVKGDKGIDIRFTDYPLYSTEELKEESIIEVSFDRSTEMFYKLRSRPDKVNPNYIKVAEDFWKDINNPIPITDLSKIELSISNEKTKYGTFKNWEDYRTYSKKRKKEVIEANLDKNSIVIDVGFGKGGDIERYMTHGITNIIGIEPDEKNIAAYRERYKGKFTIVSNSEGSDVYNLNINGRNVEILLINDSASNKSIIPIINGYLKGKEKRPVAVCMFFSLTYFFGPDDSFVNLINIMMEFNPKKILGAVMDGEKTKKFLNDFEWNEEKCGFKLKLIGDNSIYIKIEDSETVRGHEEYLTDFSRLNEFLTYYNFKLNNRTFYGLNLGETNLLTYFSGLNYTFVFDATTKIDIPLNNLIQNIVRYNDNLAIRLDASYFYNCIMGQSKIFDFETLNNKVLNGIFRNQLVNYEKIDKNKEEKSILDIKRFYNLTGRVNNSFVLTYKVPMDTTLKNIIFYNDESTKFKITNIMYDYYHNKEENDAYKVFEIINSSLPITKEYSIVEYNTGVGNYTIKFVELFKNIICVDNLHINIELTRYNVDLWHKKPITNIPIKFIEKSKEQNINDILDLSSNSKNVLFVNYILNRYKQPSLEEIKDIFNIGVIIILSENNIFNLVKYFNNFNFYKLANSYLYVIYVEPISRTDVNYIVELKDYVEGQQIIEGGAEESKVEEVEPKIFSKGDYVIYIGNNEKLFDEFGLDFLVGKITSDKPDMYGRYDVKIKDNNAVTPLAFDSNDIKLINEEQYNNPEVYDEIVMLYKRKPIIVERDFKDYDIDELLTELQKS